MGWAGDPNRGICQHGITHFAVSLPFHPNLKESENGVGLFTSVCLFLVFLCDIFLRVDIHLKYFCKDIQNKMER